MIPNASGISEISFRKNSGDLPYDHFHYSFVYSLSKAR